MTQSISLIETNSLGRCWHDVSALIMRSGADARYDGAPIKEIANLSAVVQEPDPHDTAIARFGDPAWLKWMHDNFFVQKPVPELGNASSYAIRLFNYEGLDQIQWAIDRLKQNPEARSAVITTFMPLADTSYIPCISMLDFWNPAGALELVVYAHSLDFGKKAYGNLVELAILQRMVAGGTGWPIGKLIIHAKSVHIYEPEYDYMTDLLPKIAAESSAHEPAAQPA
jgi:thymidylate synthase